MKIRPVGATATATATVKLFYAYRQTDRHNGVKPPFTIFRTRLKEEPSKLFRHKERKSNKTVHKITKQGPSNFVFLTNIVWRSNQACGRVSKLMRS